MHSIRLYCADGVVLSLKDPGVLNAIDFRLVVSASSSRVVATGRARLARFAGMRFRTTKNVHPNAGR